MDRGPGMRSKKQPTAAFIRPEQCQRVRYGYRRVQAEIARLAIGVADRMSRKPEQSRARDSLSRIHGSGEHFEYRPRCPYGS